MLTDIELKVIPLSEENLWNQYVAHSSVHDFYHSHLYHSLDTSGEPRLLVFQSGPEYLAIPLIFRNIPGTEWKDVTSVYGYAGWIGSPALFSSRLFQIMEEYMNREKVVSVFSRLHPLIPFSDRFERGNVISLNTTVGIDLSLSPDMQFCAYSESVRRSIRKGRQKGLTVRAAQNDQDLKRFACLYRSSMERLQASSRYFFSDDYFDRMWKSKSFDCIILLVEWNNVDIAGAMFTNCNGIMQYHLGGALETYVHFSPIKLLIDEARLLANANNCKYFHLGGGYGGKNDTLFIFKSRMASLYYTFKVWQWIVNPEVYKQLSINKKESDFFPLYRNSDY